MRPVGEQHVLEVEGGWATPDAGEEAAQTVAPPLLEEGQDRRAGLLGAGAVARRRGDPPGDPALPPGGAARPSAQLLLPRPAWPSHLLLQARAAPPRAVSVPTLGQAAPCQLAGPAAVDEQRSGLLRRLPHAAQPAAPAAPNRVRRPRAGAPVRPPAAAEALRQGDDRGDGR